MEMDPGLKTKELRAFLALPLAPCFQSDVAPLLEHLKKEYPKIRWVDPSQIHITLHFFGSISVDKVQEISRSVAPVTEKTGPFEISLKGLGAFPNVQRPRVVWLGVEGETEKFITLQGLIEKNLQKAGYDIEKREFKPHLTLGRIKEFDRPLELSGIIFSPTAAKRMNQIVLFQSRLTTRGAVYEAIETYPLSSP